MCEVALIRVLFGLLFCGVRVGSEEHSVQIYPASVVVRYGDPVSVNCTVSGNHEGIGWEASEGSVGMVSNVQSVIWSVDSITHWEIGPRCFVNLWKGADISQEQKTLRITLYRPPDSVSISAVNHTSPMLEGQQYQLQCEVQNIAPVQYLTLKWYKGEGELERQTFYDDVTKTPVNVSSTILITPTSADDGAQYSCVAELELGSEGPQPSPELKSDPLSFTVHYQPRITDCVKDVKLREGQTLDTLVSCGAEGKPPPVVTWTHGDQSEFSIATPLTRRDVGQYVITARNNLGSVSHNLTVWYGPIFSCRQKYVVMENEHHALMCIAEGFPVPKVNWFKEEEDKEVELPAQMTRRDAGHYTLIARNGFETASHSLDIEVLYPPSVILELESDVVDFGATVVLRCSSQGNPRPEYIWNYQNTPNVQVHRVDGVSLLNISHASEANDGFYNCTAINRIGHESKTVKLTVRGEEESLHTTINVSGCSLKVKLEPSTVVVRYGDPVEVNCTISGDHDGVGWEASEGSVGMVDNVWFLPWSLKTLTDWEIRPKCYVNLLTDAALPRQCSERLNITVYKHPDNVSISAVNHTGPMLEGQQYQLQCEVQNVAPVQYLTVKWYKGEGELEHQTFYDDVTKTPVNVSSTILITPTSADDGAQYSCVAELELGSEGPQPSPELKSDPLFISVHYPPSFYSLNDETFEVTEGEEVTLNCSAHGNPTPAYSWSPSPLNQEEKVNQTVITIAPLPPGTHRYSCQATNYQGWKRKEFTVKIVAIVDYLPLIAGVVALAVVLISIAFSFIYCIYYKNTKMGQYDLKLGKSRTQNAHVAQNGRDSSLPMKKLTQPSFHV